MAGELKSGCTGRFTFFHFVFISTNHVSGKRVTNEDKLDEQYWTVKKKVSVKVSSQPCVDEPL